MLVVNAYVLLEDIFFATISNDITWRNQRLRTWSFKNTMSHIKVVNDTAERANALMTDFNEIFCRFNQKQYILQVVEKDSQQMSYLTKSSLFKQISAIIDFVAAYIRKLRTVTLRNLILIYFQLKDFSYKTQINCCLVTLKDLYLNYKIIKMDYYPNVYW